MSSSFSSSSPSSPVSGDYLHLHHYLHHNLHHHQHHQLHHQPNHGLNPLLKCKKLSATSSNNLQASSTNLWKTLRRRKRYAGSVRDAENDGDFLAHIHQVHLHSLTQLLLSINHNSPKYLCSHLRQTISANNICVKDFEQDICWFICGQKSKTS